MSDELSKIATEPVRRRPLVRIGIIIFAIAAVALLVEMAVLVVGLGSEGY